MEKKVLKKTFKIVANVLLYLFIAICLFGVLITVMSKSDPDGTATIFGMQMRIVISPSMEECDRTDVSEYDIGSIPVDSVVFIETVPEDPAKANEWYADLKVGDVLTFKYVYVKQETITHRIVSIEPNSDGGYTILLEGDNKNDASTVMTQEINTADLNSPNYVIGKVTGTSYLLGLFITILKSPVGLICMVILPALVILVFEVVKVVRLLMSDKKKQDNKVQQAQQEELEMLRRRLAELEKSNAGAPDAPPNGEGSDHNDTNGMTP